MVTLLTLLFVICLIAFIWKFLVFGLKASWGILKLLCYVLFFPIILIVMVVGGLIKLALPILIIGGIIAFLAGRAEWHIKGTYWLLRRISVSLCMCMRIICNIIFVCGREILWRSLQLSLELWCLLYGVLFV